MERLVEFHVGACQKPMFLDDHLKAPQTPFLLTCLLYSVSNRKSENLENYTLITQL